MSVFKKINKTEYRELFEQVLFKTFFHEPDWFDFLEEEFKWLRFEHYLYKDEALLSFGKVRGKLISLPFCEYGGPLPLGQFSIFNSQFSKDVLAEFGDNAKVKFHPQILAGSSESMITYWLKDLEKISEEKLLNSFRKTLRHSIQKAEKQDLEIKKCSNLKELKQFYNLYVANLKRKKTIPYPYSIIKFLYKSETVEILLAQHNGKIIAGDLFIKYDGFVHYFLSAMDYRYRDLGANYLLLWTKIKSLIGKDIVLDLGATPQGSSLEIFKKGWGGKEYPIYQISTKKTENNLRSSKLRNIWGLLPVSVIKALSSKLIKFRL